MKKRPTRKTIVMEITQRTRLGQIFERNTEETKRIIKQMEAYGLHAIGYGIDYGKTVGQHASEQALPDQQLQNLLKSINKSYKNI